MHSPAVEGELRLEPKREGAKGEELGSRGCEHCAVGIAWANGSGACPDDTNVTHVVGGVLYAAGRCVLYVAS